MWKSSVLREPCGDETSMVHTGGLIPNSFKKAVLRYVTPPKGSPQDIAKVKVAWKERIEKCKEEIIKSINRYWPTAEKGYNAQKGLGDYEKNLLYSVSMQVQNLLSDMTNPRKKKKGSYEAALEVRAEMVAFIEDTMRSRGTEGFWKAMLTEFHTKDSEGRTLANYDPIHS